MPNIYAFSGMVWWNAVSNTTPSAVTFIASKLGLSPSEMSDYLNKKSGFMVWWNAVSNTTTCGVVSGITFLQALSASAWG
mgnify:CR=1 FL=1